MIAGIARKVSEIHYRAQIVVDKLTDTLQALTNAIGDAVTQHTDIPKGINVVAKSSNSCLVILRG